MSAALPISVWRISGDDAIKFIHGQTCNDVASLSVGQWQINAYLNLKGRVVALFWLARESEDSLVLATDASLSDGLIQRLRMFVMRSDVTFEAVEGEHVFTSNEQQNGDYGNGVWATGQPEIALVNGTAEANLGAEERLIKAGLIAPHWINSDNTDQYLPQMLNLDLINGLSFKKGCYPGQEIVARTAHRGRLKQRLQLFKTTASANSELLDEDGNKAAKILAQAGDYALAVTRLEHLGKALHTENEVQATQASLPYSLPEAAV